MTIRDLKIGDRFITAYGSKTVWIKKTEQGMNKQYSYADSEDEKQTRNPSRKTVWSRLFNQDLEILKVSSLT